VKTNWRIKARWKWREEAGRRIEAERRALLLLWHRSRPVRFVKYILTLCKVFPCSLLGVFLLFVKYFFTLCKIFLYSLWSISLLFVKHFITICKAFPYTTLTQIETDIHLKWFLCWSFQFSSTCSLFMFSSRTSTYQQEIPELFCFELKFAS